MILGNKIRKLSSFFIIILVMISLTILSVNSQKHDEYEVNFTFSALQPHDPISITSDGEFTGANGVTGGTGVSNDPYIIEGYSINASGTSFGGIYIASTTNYFVIRNCYVTDGTHSGIYISSVDHGTFLIKNNTLENNAEDGLFLTHAEYGNITDNVCINNGLRGMRFENYVQYNIITNNTCSNNGDTGISIYGSIRRYQTIFNNTIENNGGDGINIASNYHSIGNNTCLNNEGRGIVLSYGSYSYIENNTVSNSGDYGIVIGSGNDLYIRNNVLTNDGFFLGLTLTDFDQTIFENNKVNGLPLGYFVNNESIAITSNYGQLVLVNCSNINIEGKNIGSVDNAIYMTYCTGITIQTSIFTNCDDYAIHMTYCTGITIQTSIFTNCDNTAIYSYMSNDTVILLNQIYDSQVGISTFNRDPSYYTTYGNFFISSNIISNVDTGINAISSTNNTYYNNSLTNFDQDAIYIYSSTNDPLKNYTISYNEIEGSGDGITVTNANWGTKATADLSIHHNDILNSSRALTVEGVQNAVIYDNMITSFSSYGMYLQGATYPFETDIHINNNEIDHGGGGILINGLSNVFVEYNVINNIAGRGIEYGGDNLTCRFNEVDQCSGCGIMGIGANLLFQENSVSNVVYAAIIAKSHNITIYKNTLSYSSSLGIVIPNDASNVTILENEISNCNYGIDISNNCDQITIANCTIDQFSDPIYGIGILIFGSSNIDILHNEISGAPNIAIDIDGNGQSAKYENYFIYNNLITYSGAGINVVNGAQNIIIQQNVIRYSYYDGISISGVSYVDITENKVVTSTYYGISVDSSNHVNITYNLIQDSIDYGIYVSSSSSYVTVHHNTLYGNNLGEDSQAKDDGTNNIWYDSTVNEGNYWDDWSGSGIYSIDGTAGSEDLYPLGSALEPPLIKEFRPLLIPILVSVLSLVYIYIRKRK